MIISFSKKQKFLSKGFLLFLFGLIMSCLSTPNQSTLDKPNSQVRIFYQIFVPSFADSNGDGIGDFIGIMNRIDYLVELGIEGVWLSPIHPADSYHKYDVMDYKAVASEFGTLADFMLLKNALQERGIKVVLDMVFNHSSELNPWFQDALKGPESPYRDYYVWKHPRESNPDPDHWHIPQQKGADISETYYGFFWKGMPDLNSDNPKVRAEIADISAFWLNEIGVDGFRLDAALHIHSYYPHLDPSESIRYWKEMRPTFDKIKEDAFLFGEVWEGNKVIAPFLDKGIKSCFNFQLSEGIQLLLNGKLERDSFLQIIHDYQELYTAADPDFQDAIFLTNHDQNRICSVLSESKKKSKLAAQILFTLPGHLFIYYGEEIGMLGEKPDESIREPMIWDWPKAKDQAIWRNHDFNSKGKTASVKQQKEDKESMLNHYKSLIQFRKQNEGIQEGKISPIPNLDLPEGLLAYASISDKGTYHIFHNLSGNSFQIREEWIKGTRVFPVNSGQKMKEYGTRVYKVK